MPRAAGYPKLPDLPPDVAPGQLITASLESIHFELHRDWDLDTGATVYAVDFDVEASVPPASPRPTAHLRLAIDWDPEGEKVGPFELSLTVGGEFEWQGTDQSVQRLGDWIRTNGLYLLWPYVRQHVTMVTAAAGLPPLYLETLQVMRAAWDEPELFADPYQGA